jgi:FeS assembly SUF system protein
MNPADHLLNDALQASEETSIDQPKSAQVSESDSARDQILLEQIVDVLRSVYDPEIPVNIYEMGLIYDVAVNSLGEVGIRMTLTSPACPVAGTLPIEVENKVAALPGVNNCEVEVVWDPPYSMEMMSEAARLQMGLL